MRRVLASALLLLLAAGRLPAQDGCDSGIEEDSKPTGPAPAEPKKPVKEPERAPPGGEEDREAGDGFTAPTIEEINRAIDRGVEWLKKAQQKDGSWGPCTAEGHYGDPNSKERTTCFETGPTSFALFALGTCGVSRDDRVVRDAIKWLQKQNGEWTSYECAAAILALTTLNGTKPPRDAKSLPRSSGARPPKGAFKYEDWSMMGTRLQGLLACMEMNGGFGYWDRGDGNPDGSATQFAILALRAASFAGYPVEKQKPDLWKKNVDFLVACQAKSGGFPYHKRDEPSRGMTAASLSSLLICREQMALQQAKEPAGLGGAIANGLKYLDDNFSLDSNPSSHFEGRSHYHYCHLYGVERTGMLSGRRELGGKDWYIRGAAWLLAKQADDGSWHDGTCMEPQDTLGTCFALLFLKKATPPPVTQR